MVVQSAGKEIQSIKPENCTSSIHPVFLCSSFFLPGHPHYSEALETLAHGITCT